MATVTITYFKPAEYEGFGIMGEIDATETITSSGTSQQSTDSALPGNIVRIASSGGAVHAIVGNNPTADTDDPLVTDGNVEYFQCNSGDKAAIIDAS